MMWPVIIAWGERVCRIVCQLSKSGVHTIGADAREVYEYGDKQKF
jgi:hypothetical protein